MSYDSSWGCGYGCISLLLTGHFKSKNSWEISSIFGVENHFSAGNGVAVATA